MGDGIMNYTDDLPRTEISKELEKVNFETMMKCPELSNSEKETKKSERKRRFKHIFKNEVHPKDKKLKFNNIDSKSQVVSFQQAMKLLFIFGQCLGLKPVMGSFQNDVNKMRFTLWNWRCIHSIIIGSAQVIAASLCMYRFLKVKTDLGVIAFFAFFLTASVTTFLMIHVSYKWPKLLQKLSKSHLDEYIDQKVKCKCITATCIIIIISVIEHILSINSKFSQIKYCYPNSNVYEKYTHMNFPWYAQLELPIDNHYSLPFLHVLNIISTLNWNYSDVFIMCISIYLQSILKQINLKIISASKKRYMQSSYWKSLREDYNKASRLVRSFDEVISGVIFISFASNLFFICLQIYNIIGYGLKPTSCPNEFNKGVVDYDLAAYLLFSLMYLVVRFLSVSVIASGVHSESLIPAPALYDVPSSAYCPEVARFIDQVNYNLVALSGLKFFYVTRDLVLSVAGTIVTYELVLLQFNSN